MLRRELESNDIRRGEIYWVKLPLFDIKENIRELQGPHPCLVVSNDEQNKFSPLITVLPLTSKIDKIYPFQVFSKIGGKNGIILVDQIRTIDRKRFIGKLGKISFDLMGHVERALHTTLALRS